MLTKELNVAFMISGKEMSSGKARIAMGNNFEFKIHKTVEDNTGRYLIVDIEIP